MPLEDTAAERLVDDLGIRDPADLVLEDIAWALGALVTYQRLDGAAARLVVRGDRSVITCSESIEHSGRRRFAVAHELGHLRLHAAKSNLNQCVRGDFEERLGAAATGADLEAQASRFASALLMPRRLFGPACERESPSLEIVRDLASRFGTSLTASALRYIDFCKEGCAVVWSEDNRIRWYKKTRDFGFHVRVHDELDPYSIAFDFFDGKPMADRLTAVDASCWLAPGRYRADGMIKEHSFGIRSLNSVLTLLWVSEDLEPGWEPSEDFTPDGRWRRR